MQSLSSQKTQSWLSWFLRGVLILGFLFLLGRLIELTAVKGAYFRELSEENRIKRIVIRAPRGNIIAKGGGTIAGSAEEKITTELGDEIPSWRRYYPLGASAGHLTGYLGEVEGDEVGKVNPDCPEKGPYKLGQLVGRDGLEGRYECQLAGIDGEELIEVNTRGEKIRVIGRREVTPGADIKVSIDVDLQLKAALEMKDTKGAVVATNEKGEILALFSSPSFDPNLFVKAGDKDDVIDLLTSPDLPFFNRAIGGLFHPGSVFKPLVTIAALEEGRIDEDYRYDDTGKVSVNEYDYTNWYFTQYGGVEGEIDLTRALARSTDTFFYKVGEALGINKLVYWTRKFGFDELSQIDIPGELPGLVPDPDWKKKVKGENWFLGNTYHFSIGQGDLSVTPLAINRLTLGVATGELCTQTLVETTECKGLGVNEDNLELVRAGMTKACEPEGTGFTFFDFTPKVSCKTGTAETNDDGKTHAWFTLFAPNDNPKIVLTVLVEGGGEGSKVAGPIARKIMDEWKASNPQ